jgi:hypothetical protein
VEIDITSFDVRSNGLIFSLELANDLAVKEQHIHKLEADISKIRAEMLNISSTSGIATKDIENKNLRFAFLRLISNLTESHNLNKV